MDNFAPVLIPTLNRYEHFKRCVQSLAACTYADKTDLFIALDYPSDDRHWEGYRKIDKYLSTIQGYNSVEVFRREKNFGQRQNTTNARKVIFESFDRIISSEDDNEFSPNFLDYMNKGLDKFEDDDSVLAICGYLYPFTLNCTQEYNYFYGKGFSAWGYGTWKNRNFKRSYTVSELKELLKIREFVKKIKYYHERDYFNILGYIERNQDPTGDRAIVIYLIEKDFFCIFPVESKVRNWGHDGSGIHCVNLKDDPFINQKIDIGRLFEYSKKRAINNSCFDEILRRYFRMSLKEKIKFFTKGTAVYNLLEKFWIYRKKF